MLKTVFENESICIKETGQPYDFAAIIINKTDKDIALVMDEDIAAQNAIVERFDIPANEWVGLCVGYEYDGNTKQALLQGDYKVTNIEPISR